MKKLMLVSLLCMLMTTFTVGVTSGQDTTLVPGYKAFDVSNLLLCRNMEKDANGNTLDCRRLPDGAILLIPIPKDDDKR